MLIKEEKEDFFVRGKELKFQHLIGLLVKST